MLYLEKAIECARTPGRHGPFMDRFFELVEQATVFVIQNEDCDSEFAERSHPDYQNTLLDLPFKTCWFEFFKPAEGIHGDTEDSRVYTHGFLVHEATPGEYEYFELAQEDVAGRDDMGDILPGFNFNVMPVAATGPDDAVIHWTKGCLNELRKCAVGTERANLKIKIGTGKTKRHHKIREIVHVVPKKMQSARPSFTTATIDWTHRFAVRGHWRKIRGLGKDRDGKYSVRNFTWVSECIKGPKDKPFVKKPRFVRAAPGAEVLTPPTKYPVLVVDNSPRK